MVIRERNEYSGLIKRRMEVVFLVYLLLIAIVGARLGYLQWVRARDFQALSERMEGRTLSIDADRGRIRDRNGAELATDVLGKAIAMNPRLVTDPEATVRRLGQLLKLDQATQRVMLQRLVRAKERKSFYCQLRRGVERREAEAILKRAREDPLLRGLWLEDSPMRVHPSGQDASQIVGSVNADGHGIEASELYFDKILRGKNGQRHIRVNAVGELIPASEQRVVEPEDGADVCLAVDRDIQHFVEVELAKVAREQQPDSATAIVMDVKTGDILAMANWPTFHPRDRQIRPEQRRNRAITDLLEPGSTFKVFTAAAALETGVPLNVYCGGSKTAGNRTVRCAHGDKHGPTDLRRMIEKSCNVSAGTLAERVGPKRLYAFLDQFGFQQKTGVEFPGEEYARMLPPEKWRPIRTVNIGFGQGILTSPIQLVAGYAAIANDGVYMPPRLVLDAPGMDLPKREPRRVMSAANAAKLRAHMAAVVATGTGKRAKIAGYSVAGKTGTAQIAENGRYGSGYVASFIGFVPATQPRLAILASVWRPRRDQYGGVVAAPLFREIARHSVAYLKIPPDQPHDLTDGDDTRMPSQFQVRVDGDIHD